MITFRPVSLPDDVALLHAWVTHPRSVFWQMQSATPAEVCAEYAAIERAPGHEALIGLVDGSPAFLCEYYDPQHTELAGLPALRAGDLGMHVLVAPPTHPVSGFTRKVFAAVMRRGFADPLVQRVVVEPDERNDKIQALNAAAGFEVLGPVRLSHKRASLSLCTRESFEASELAGAIS